MADNLSGIGDAMRKAAEALAEAISSVSKSIQSSMAGMAAPDRERLVENWLRIARMSKDGAITAIEHGYETWEREVRRLAGVGSGAASASSDPMAAFTENLRKATEAVMSGASGIGEEARKQTESLQKTVSEGIRTWQKLWESDRK
jgi:coproporphyrinogen III oxidase-like Fe-S oxidoreductase